MNRYLGMYDGAAYALLRIVLGFLHWSHGPAWLFGAFDGPGPVRLTSLQGVAGMLDLTMGTLVAIGLFAPWAAFIASGEMAYAYFFVHVPRGNWMPIVNGSEITVALCFGFLYIATRGAGSFSIDSWRASRRAAK